MNFFPHHQAAIDRVIAHFQPQPDVLALFLSGSIAHGFALESSDVDIQILIPDASFQDRLERKETTFFSLDLASYEGGYIDGKYVSEAFLSEVEAHGSEPARFAYADIQILFSRVDGLQERLDRLSRYPFSAEEKVERIKRFHAQLDGWLWFSSEAERKQNPYLMTTAVSRLILFGARMLLAHNEMLYPFHKWMLKVLEGAPHKPEGIIDLMRETATHPTRANAVRIYEAITTFRQWERDPGSWGNRFMADSELTWMRDAAAIEDI